MKIFDIFSCCKRNSTEIKVSLYVWQSCEQGPYSQHSIFFITYESAQKARVFHNTMLERLTSDKHSNLLGQFLSYEENEVLWICTQNSTAFNKSGHKLSFVSVHFIQYQWLYWRTISVWVTFGKFHSIKKTFFLSNINYFNEI